MNTLSTTTDTALSLSAVNNPWISGQIDTRNIVYDRIDVVNQSRIVLGSGGEGKVYRARLHGEPVAAKHVRLPPKRSSFWQDSTMKDREAEIKLLEAINGSSEHIVGYRGHAYGSDAAGQKELILITELMGGGTLDTALREKKVKWKQNGARIALDIALGLDYLHALFPVAKVIHFDLKPQNVLLTANFSRAKIVDFGESITLPHNRRKYIPDRPIGTPMYASPEQRKRHPCSTAEDIYSFGVILWEICTGERAKQRKDMRQVQVPEECPFEVVELIQRCFSRSHRRPDAKECIEMLESQIK